MAWIGGVIAASAARKNNSRKRKPQGITSFFLLFSFLIISIFPIIIFLVHLYRNNINSFNWNIFFILIVGLLISLIFILLFILKEYSDEGPSSIDNESNKLYCYNCGSLIKEEDNFCQTCGWRTILRY